MGEKNPKLWLPAPANMQTYDFSASQQVHKLTSLDFRVILAIYSQSSF